MKIWINLLGFSLDSKLTFNNQVNRVYGKRYIQLRKFYSIQKFFGEKQRRELASFFVLLSLKYSNVIYLHLSCSLCWVFYSAYEENIWLKMY